MISVNVRLSLDDLKEYRFIASYSWDLNAVPLKCESGTWLSELPSKGIHSVRESEQ
jgi:hypothetical protein